MLLDHPGEGHVGNLLVLVSAANVGVDAGEPDLLEVRGAGGGLGPHRRGEGAALLVEGECVEGVVDGVGEVGVVEAVSESRGRGVR